jgi:hypothetical protein
VEEAVQRLDRACAALSNDQVKQAVGHE